MKHLYFLFAAIFLICLSGCTLASNEKIESEFRHVIETGENRFFVAIGPRTKGMFSSWRSRNAECLIQVKKTNKTDLDVGDSHHAIILCDGEIGTTFFLKRGWGKYAGKFHIRGFSGGTMHKSEQ